TPHTYIYTLSLHDALPIYDRAVILEIGTAVGNDFEIRGHHVRQGRFERRGGGESDRVISRSDARGKTVPLHAIVRWRIHDLFFRGLLIQETLISAKGVVAVFGPGEVLGLAVLLNAIQMNEGSTRRR